MERKTYKGIDIIKLLAAIGVVAIHTNFPLLNIIGRMGVPLFAIFSSFFFFKHYLIARDKNTFLNSFLKRIFYLFIAWEIVYSPLAIKSFFKMMNMWGGISLINIFKYLICFVFPATYNANGVDITYNANGWDISWYLLATLAGIPLMLIILKVFHNNLKIIGFFCLSLEFYFILINEFGYITKLPQIGTHTCIRLLIYFFIGYIIALKESKLCLINKKAVLFINVIFILIFLVENILVFKAGGSYTSEEVFSTVPTTCITAITASLINLRSLNTFKLRQFSTFLYCSQKWPLIIFEKFYIMNNNIYLFISVLVMCFILYIIYIYTYGKFRFSFLKYFS